MNPKPDKCQRTDGRKWRCSKNVILNEKYCERHMHRGHSQSSRKLVEPSQSTPNKATCPDVQEGLDAKMEIFAQELEDEIMKNDSDVEIDIMTVPTESQELSGSEGSSLLEESDSDFENVDTLGKSEALSDFCDDVVSALDIDGFGDGSTHRRKKLTAHWRSFIQPIMWRCKWTEIKIKKLQSLAPQYDTELEAQSKRKQIQLEGLTPIDGVKSVPFSRTNDVNDLAGRKKRRMTKVTTDVAEYMSCHNLFSYYENKKSSTKGASLSDLPRISATQKVNSGDEFWANNDLLAFTDGDGANCLSDILRKIEFLRSQSGQLRSRVDTIICENADKIFSADKLTLCNDGDRVDVGT